MSEPTQLTARQTEIKGLIEQGMKAPQIAQQLGISPNAVYQNIRRMKDRSGSAPKAKTSGDTTAKAAKPATPNITGQGRPTRPVTPLQSLRDRREEIKGEIKAAESERDTAQRAATKAQEAMDKLAARYADELTRLDAAEAALKGEAAPTKPQAPARTGKPAEAATPRPKSTGKKSGAKSNGTGPAPDAATQAANEAKIDAQPTPPVVGEPSVGTVAS